MRRALRRVLLALVLLGLAWQLWLFVHILWWTRHNPQTTALMRERMDELAAHHQPVQLQHEWVPWNRIPVSLKRAVVASEDSRFIEHHGFDWQGIRLAAQKDLQHGRIVAGGSTISQQLAKNLLLSDHRTPWRKIEETLVTVMIEQTMSKRRILEIYLNDIEWGHGIFGAQAAARHYFHTGAANLLPQQSARLAAMIPDPRYFDSHRNSHELARRTAIIAARMNQVVIPR